MTASWGGFLSGPPLPLQLGAETGRGNRMDGKKSPTIKPSDFSDDRIERSLAEEREFLRRAEEDLRLEEDRLTKSSAERTEWQNRGKEYLARLYKDSEKSRRQIDKEWEEGSIQRREFQAKLHKVSMSALSRLESQITERPQVREESRTARLVGQGNTRKPRHDLLKALIGTTKRKYPGISHRDLCMRLDTMTKPVKLPPSSTWQKQSAETSWIGNYDCDAVRPLIDTYFSKIPSVSPKRKSTT
jgi:hypothetical protein